MIQCTSITKEEHPNTTWPILYILEFIEDGNDCEEHSITLDGLIFHYDLIQEDLAGISGITVIRKLAADFIKNA